MASLRGPDSPQTPRTREDPSLQWLEPRGPVCGHWPPALSSDAADLLFSALGKCAQCEIYRLLTIFKWFRVRLLEHIHTVMQTHLQNASSSIA